MKRKVKILATLGPSSSSPAMIARLLKAGVNGMRLNFSHGDHASHARTFKAIRKTADKLGLPVAVVADLQGPKIRVGALTTAVPVRKGSTLTITTRKIKSTLDTIPCTYKKLAADVRKGDRLLVDDGLIELQAMRTTRTDVICKVKHGGIIRERKGINLPGVKVSASSITAKDVKDLKFALELGVDYIAVSFVRTGKGIKKVKRIIAAQGQDIPVIAKIEKPEALDNIDEIMAASDGIMVARGDLAVETAPEIVPVAQKSLLGTAHGRGKLDVVATQMLDSMVKNLTPTRAEASDVANAVLDGADVVMLSQETAVGDNPVHTVRMMDRIVRKAEASIYFPLHEYIPDDRDNTPLNGITHAACLAADETRAAALVVYSLTGESTAMISMKRPSAPIFALTPDEDLYRRFSLLYNVTPVECKKCKGLENTFRAVKATVVKKGLLRKGSTIVMLVNGVQNKRALRVDTV